MPRVSAPIYSVNGGEVGDEALGRLDLERMQFAGSLYSNMLPRVIGAMTLRPGLEHITDIDLGEVQLMEYSYSGGSTLLPILSNGEMRVVKDRAFVGRVAVSTVITNGDFASFTGWTDNSTGGGSAGVSGGNLSLTGTTQGRGVARQTLTVSAGDQPKEHAIRLVVTRGPVNLRLGTSAGMSEILEALSLDDGPHSIAFTPGAGSVFLELSNDKARLAIVDSCVIEGPGTMVIPTPWLSADLSEELIRYKQHKDVVYVASTVYQQRTIQRRSDTSWGVQRYKVDDGPFIASDGLTSLQPNGVTGNINLIANRNYFEPGMVGRLFRLFQSGQSVTEAFSSAPAEGDFVRVSGVGAARGFQYSITGTWTGTIRMQVATDDGSGNPAAWIDLSTFTSNVAFAGYTDPDNNVIKYFRFALQPGDLTSGSVTATIAYPGGSRFGIARMTDFVSRTVAAAEVISRFYATSATFEWDNSVWSDYDGWPAAVEAFGGRMYWGHGDFIYGSVPDAYKSFDDNIEGDSAPIARSIGSNTDRGILWLMGLQRLLAGTDASEVSVKSSSFDEPLTASSWFPIESSTRGCANLRAVKCDKDGIFVQTSETAIFALTTGEGSIDYGSTDLTEMHEDICDGYEIVDIAVQRRPDTVLWFILANGEARALTYEPSRRVIAWSRVVTDGLFKRVAAVRGAGQDAVYFAIVRNGTQRLERLANLKDCHGGQANCLADGFTRFDLVTPQTTFSVPHLNGRQVMVWADGAARHDQSNLYTVSGNQVVLASPATTAVVIGLPYVGRYQSTKLAYGAANGTALFKRKRVAELGLYLTKTMMDGVRAGRSFNDLKRLTTTKDDKPIPPGYLWDQFDMDLVSVTSDWDTDSRICVEAKAPYPFTASSLVLDVQTNG